MNRSFFKFENCLSLNFDYFDINLSIPQIATTPESELKLTFDFPSSCFFVIVGGKYLNKIGSVMEKVDSITNDMGEQDLWQYLSLATPTRKIYLSISIIVLIDTNQLQSW